MAAAFRPLWLVVLVGQAMAAVAQAEERPLLRLDDASDAGRFKPSSKQVAVAPTDDGTAVVMHVAPGQEGYPGAVILPEGSEVWDLSLFGHVEARVTNLGEVNTTFSMRIDNQNDGSSGNTEGISIEPGATRTARVIFGHSFGFKRGFPLDPARVRDVLVFVHKSDKPQSVRIESIRAGGPAGEVPPVHPEAVRISPQDGYLLRPGMAIEPDRQIQAANGAIASVGDKGLAITFRDAAPGQSVTVKPALGRWNLTRGNELRFTITNMGATPFSPQILLTSDKGQHPVHQPPTPLAAGERREVTVPFVAPVPWAGVPDSGDRTSWDGQPGTGTKLGSDAVGGVRIGTADAGGGSILVESIRLAVGIDTPPVWLGTRPPVEGDWVASFNEDFDGQTLDARWWSCQGENYYDTRSHYSRENAILANGTLALRYEKKRGSHNDDPAQTLALTNPRTSESDYATGFLSGYGRWVQRYGYFEARMKLPDAPGLWPAFWLMPDRGAAAGPQWVRADTGNGGMEFDILEPLTRWGPYRFNIAFHWDGYQAGHKQTGSEQIYFRPDKDGFVTVGLLWLPGSATIYVNGREAAGWKDARISNIPSHFLFTHVSGGWDNNALDDKTLPADFVIDYVRAWQRKDLASDADGVQARPDRAAAAPAPAEADVQGDVVIYGGTSAAVVAAVRAAMMGASVVVVSPDRHLGGLTSGGLGYTDSGNTRAIGGLSRDFYRRVWKHYQATGAWRWQPREAFHGVGQEIRTSDLGDNSMWLFEPHVAEKIFEAWIHEHGIRVFRDCRLDRASGVACDVPVPGAAAGRRIVAIRTEATPDATARRFSGKVFIDATYEGDLMAAAGVTYHVGREANSVYGETWNGNQVGILHHDHFFKVPVDPFRTPGQPTSGLVPLVSADAPGTRGDGDRRVQAYCFRMCLTDHPDNRVPFTKPQGYDGGQYELLARVFAAGWRDVFRKFDAIPNRKTDTNNHGPFSFDHIGMNYDYPETSYARRREIIAEHERYQQGLLWFLSHDDRVPREIREAMGRWGLPRDEFVDNDHWPRQLYIREARRMVGEDVLTEHECLGKRAVDRPIGMGSYTLDSHNVRRYVTAAGTVQNEGDIGVHPKAPYSIGYGSLVPKRNECGNLLVPVCCSASHIAYGSVRMEPVFMLLADSAATAAVLAARSGVAVQDVEYASLRGLLESHGQVLAIQPAGR